MDEFNDKIKNSNQQSEEKLALPFSVDLSDKTAVVTGGAGVLCSYFARALALSGAKVAILDLNLEAAEKVVSTIKREGGIAKAFLANVLDKKSLIKAKNSIIKEFKTCDILINGAGGNHPKGTTSKEFLFADDLDNSDDSVQTFMDLDPKGIQFVFDLNFLGTFLVTQVFLPELMHSVNSCIINISSMNAFRPLTKIPAYSAAKSALSNFTQWLAVHLSKLHIRVNAIAPGFFLTNQNRDLLLDKKGKFTERAQKIINHTPLGRFGKPEDLLGTLLWLIDNTSSNFITGTVIPVDGGFSAYSGV
ncbi:MAG: SDR family oxidoreductase [Promethearchaeota archaeon]